MAGRARWCVYGICLGLGVLALAGCADEPASPAPDEEPASIASVVSPAAPAPVPLEGLAVLTTQDSPAGLQRLESVAKSPEAKAQDRYNSLRRLEELSHDQAVATAVELARSEDPLLRTNAIGVLARSRTPAAKRALAQLPKRDLALAKRLMRGGVQ